MYTEAAVLIDNRLDRPFFFNKLPVNFLGSVRPITSTYNELIRTLEIVRSEWPDTVLVICNFRVEMSVMFMEDWSREFSK